MGDGNKTDDKVPAGRRRELKSILEAAQLAVCASDLDVLLQNMLQIAMSFTDMPVGTVALYDADHCRLEISADAGPGGVFAACDLSSAENGWLSSEILVKGRLFVVGDAAADCLTGPPVVAEGIRSLLAVPLRIEQRTVGVLALGDFKSRDFTPEEQECLSILSSFAAVSIDRTRLRERADRHEQRQFEKTFAEEVARARRYEKPLSILLVTIDNFEDFKDAFGLPGGEALLRELANMLQELLRESDKVFRFGSEQFVAILPETPRGEAGKVAERIRIFVETESPHFLTQITRPRGVTVSVGVAALHDDGVDLPSLMETAAGPGERS
jgi:diguanylate cyclase (GGDEF)-like protein